MSRITRSVALVTLLSTLMSCGGVAKEESLGSGGAGVVSGGGGAQMGSGEPIAPASGGAAGIDIEPDPFPVDLPPIWNDLLEHNLRAAPYEDGRLEWPEVARPLSLGSPGWRESGTRVCPSMRESTRAELWADEDGVALLVAADCVPILDGHGYCGTPGVELWYNDGGGWRWLLGVGRPWLFLGGVPGGDLLMGGPAVVGAQAISRSGMLGSTSPNVFGAVWALGDDGIGAAYGLFGTSTSVRTLQRFDGTTWDTLRGTENTGIAATTRIELAIVDDVAYVAAEGLLHRAVANAPFELLPNVPVIPYLGITGTSAEGLWAASNQGQILHFDGQAWSAIGTFSGTFKQFWSDGESVYFVSEAQFGLATEDSVEILATLPFGSFQSVAGISPTEIFVSVLDELVQDYACDGQYVFFFDGAEFHRL